MTTSLSKIKQAGFDVFLHGDGFKIKPSSKLTTTHRDFLKSHKAEIISELQAEKLRKPETFISCGQCLNFKCFNQHGQGAGLCLAGVQSSGSSWWSETEHQCSEFNAAVQWQEIHEPKPDAHFVICFSPNGTAFEIEARDAKHGVWLKQMSLKRTTAHE